MIKTTNHPRFAPEQSLSWRKGILLKKNLNKKFFSSNKHYSEALVGITHSSRTEMKSSSPVDLAAQEAVSELVDDMYAALRDQEWRSIPCIDLMDSQPEIRWNMRTRLLEFMSQSRQVFGLKIDTFALAVSILDRYTSRRVINARHYQLVGCVAIWLAAKAYDDKRAVPSAADLAYLCASTYAESMFNEMEFHILASLEWSLLVPTSFSFVELLVTQVVREFQEVEAENIYDSSECAEALAMSRYLCECALYSRECLSFAPSAMASAAVGLAFVVLDAMSNKRRPFVCPEDCTQHCFEALTRAVMASPPEVACRQDVADIADVVTHFFALSRSQLSVAIPQAAPFTATPYSGCASPTSGISSPQSSITLPLTPDDNFTPNVISNGAPGALKSSEDRVRSRSFGMITPC